MTTTMTMMLMTSMMFPMTKHPLSMGMILIMQTILIALTTGLMINSFWFSYILIIMILSGALVLFIYMASVASNEKFNMSMPMLMIIIISIMIISIMPFFMDQMKTSKIWSTLKKNSLENDQIMNLIKMFNMNNMSITIIMISYLFFTMIMISYIVNTFEGPLRTKN